MLCLHRRAEVYGKYTGVFCCGLSAIGGAFGQRSQDDLGGRSGESVVVEDPPKRSSETRRCGQVKPADAVMITPQSGSGVAGRVCAWAVRESVAQECGGDGAFSARVRNRRFRMCGGRACMLGRRVCRRWCNLQNMKNHPWSGDWVLLCCAWRERGVPRGGGRLAAEDSPRFTHA